MTDSNQVPEWLQQLANVLEERLLFQSVGQLDFRWTPEGELLVAPAVFEVSSEDDQNGEQGYGVFEIPDVRELAELLSTEQDGPATISCGVDPDTDVLSMTIDGWFAGRDVILQLQFEPFEDAEPTFVLTADEMEEPDLLEEEEDEEEAGEVH